MRFLGGKASTAKVIASAMLARAAGRDHYVEPFMGSGAVLERMAPHFGEVDAGDLMPGLAGMWNAIIEGWQPELTLSEARYRELQSMQDCPQKLLAGFGASFGGKWFGGYARPHRSQPDPYGTSARVAIRRARAFSNARIAELDYREWRVSARSLVYCDPPYSNTVGFPTGPFDHLQFWHTCQQWAALGALVFISEYEGFGEAKCILSMRRQSRVRKGDASFITDKLFVLPAKLNGSRP